MTRAPSRRPLSKAKPSRRPVKVPQLTTDLGSGFPLGKTGRTHPPLGLGLWAMGRWRPEDEAHTKATIGRALERGIGWFDTAEVYGAGRSERILGEVLRRAASPQSPPLIVTKVSWEHLKATQVRASLLGSLQRLGQSSVDLFLVHAPSSRVPIAETMRALEELWKEGKVGALGVSNFSVAEMEAARAGLRETDLVANQVLFNLFDRTDGEAVMDYCRRTGVVVEAYTPLARGLLAGRYLEGEPPHGTEAGGPLVRERFPEYQRRARALAALAQDARVPLTSLALHWLVRRGAAPVFGASRPEQIDATLEAWRARPSDRVLDRADSIARGDEP